MDESKERFLTFSISEYLDLFFKKRDPEKLGMVITNKQVAYSIGNYLDHWAKTVELSKTMYPNRGYNHAYYYQSGIWIYSTGNDITINLPDVLNKTQYECLKELVNDILEYEEENNVKIEYFDPESVLSEAKEKLGRTYDYDSDEVIMTESKTWQNSFSTETMSAKAHNLKEIDFINFESEYDEKEFGEFI